MGIGISGCLQLKGGIKGKSDQADKIKNEIKFIAVGDPHAKYNFSENRGNERLIQIVNFINKSDIDFAVFMGDMADSGTDREFKLVQDILKDLAKPYYIVAGNHDVLISQEIFEKYYGPMESIEYINGYQLLFIGIHDEKDENGKQNKLYWSFDFNKADKELPTLVFIHGAVKGPPPTCERCEWKKDFFGYGITMLPELYKFTELIGVYSGHVHYDSYQIFDKINYITINGLVHKEAGGIIANPSDNVGLSIIKNNRLDYKLVPYLNKNNVI